MTSTFLQSLDEFHQDKFFMMLRLAEEEVRASPEFKKMFSINTPELSHRDMNHVIIEFADNLDDNDPDRVDFYKDLNYEIHPHDAYGHGFNNETYDFICELIFNPYECCAYTERD